MDDRLPTHFEVTGLLRQAETQGGFGTVLRKGDADRGSILLVILSRGTHQATLERVLSTGGGYKWKRIEAFESPGSLDMVNFLARRARFDADLWAVELDIPDAERFIAETTASG